MKKKVRQIGRWIKTRLMLVAPGKNAVTGATKGLFFFTAIF